MKPFGILATLSLLLLQLLHVSGDIHTIAISTLTDEPEGWFKLATPDPTRLLRFHLSLRAHNSRDLESHLINVSNPGHEHYGQHLSKEFVQTYLKPSSDARSLVEDWLQSHNINHLEEQGSTYFTFYASVEQAESLLDTTFHTYRHPLTGRSLIRALSYSVPTKLHEHIQMIQPTTRFDTMVNQPYSISRSAYKDPGQLADTNHQPLQPRAVLDPGNFDPVNYDPVVCNESIVPSCLRGLYGLGNINATLEKGGYSLGLAGFLDNYARMADFQEFREKYAPWIDESFGLGLIAINGTVNRQDDNEKASFEAQLDIQYAMALAPNIDTWYILTPGRGTLLPDEDQPDIEDNNNEPFLDQLLALLSLPSDKLPRVISYSYGENEQSVPLDYATQVCNMFGLLSMRGVSIIVASGDSGPGRACISNRNGSPRFTSIFPASCPWVTAVGGTTNVDPEIAWRHSSGGFSDYFPAPSYQGKLAQPRIVLVNDTGIVCSDVDCGVDLVNLLGRRTPDVAAQADAFHVIDKGHDELLSGTSASAPVFAAVIANLNRIRWQQGKPSLGFLNPWLYSLPPGKGLTDIVDGYSVGCSSTNFTKATGAEFGLFNCGPGWDAVTGLGTPVFDELVAAMP